MAASAQSSHTQLMSGVKFMGPAQQEFSSLQEQSLYFLNSYWPRWNDYSNPESYIIPPIFKYKNADVSVELFENMQRSAAGTTKGPPAIINHRLADEAEHLVFDAIEELKNERIQAPFICIQGLDLRLNENNGKLHGPLTELFPHLAWDTLRQVMNRPNAEYDFILIGPNIGIIVIEVKSSHFTQSKHFCDKNSALPDGYKHGLVQLESADAILYFLETCTGVGPVSEVPFLKIMFTPNLERKRFENWMDTLTTVDKSKVHEKICSTVRWFKEDTMNRDEHSKKPSLYTAMKVFFETAKAVDRRFYEGFVPILAAMACMRTLARQGSSSIIQLDQDWFSECTAILNEHTRITKQNLGEDRRVQKSLIKSAGPHSGVMFLTPDQQAALNGPLRQFIVGAGGTGKTIILQAKALELLAKGESVVVIAHPCYRPRYKRLFDSHGYDNYRLEDLGKFQMAIKCIKDLSDANGSRLIEMKPDEAVSRCLDSNDPKYDELRNSWLFDTHEHTILDDASDLLWNYTCLSILKSVLTLAKRLSPDKLFWIAIDTDEAFYKPFATISMAEFAENIDDENYSVSYLRHVMRCSKHVFSTAYTKGGWPSDISPILGHSIQGMRSIYFNQHYKKLKKAISNVANKASAAVQQLLEKGLSLNDMAIIYDVTGGYYYHYKFDPMLRKMLTRMLRVKHMEEESEGHYKLTLIAARKRHLDGTLTLARWDCVSSYEWPVVFAINVYKKNDHKQHIRYSKYRATTRATVQLVEIIATCDDDDIQTSKLARMCCVCS